MPVRRPAFRLIGGFLLLELLAVLPMLLGRAFGSRQFSDLPSTLAWGAGVAGFLLAVPYLLRWAGIEGLPGVGLRRDGWGRHLATGLGVGLLSVLAYLALGLAAGRFSITGLAQPGVSAYWFLACTLAAFWPAISEEIIYRGYLNRACPRTWSPLWPYLSTAVLFAAAHIWNQGAGPVRMTELILDAIIYMTVLRATGSLWFAVGRHWAWNTLNLWLVEKDHLLVKAWSTDGGAAWGRYSLLAVAVTTLLLLPLIVRWLGRERTSGVITSGPAHPNG